MKKLKLPISLLIMILLITLTLFIGCSEYSYSTGKFYAGEEVTPRQIAEISAALSTTAGDDAVPAAAVKKNVPATAAATTAKTLDTDDNGNIVVYWTKSGSVWHCDSECGSLANSTNILRGSIGDAIGAGKNRMCQKCGKDIDPANLQSVTSKEDEPSDIDNRSD